MDADPPAGLLDHFAHDRQSQSAARNARRQRVVAPSKRVEDRARRPVFVQGAGLDAMPVSRTVTYTAAASG